MLLDSLQEDLGGMNKFFKDSPSHSMKPFNDGGGDFFLQVFTKHT